MTRTIKFRAWDKKKKEWRKIYTINLKKNDYSVIVQVKSSHRETLGNERIILVQSTGLLDKNGKEVYEGDIVKFMSDDGVVEKEVVYEPSIASFVVKFDSRNHYIGHFIEVIGNIYENHKIIK